jgi:hypothetical protein
VQETDVIQAQQCSDDRVVFVPSAGDGVEALIAFFELARGDIEQPGSSPDLQKSPAPGEQSGSSPG